MSSERPAAQTGTTLFAVQINHTSSGFGITPDYLEIVRRAQAGATETLAELLAAKNIFDRGDELVRESIQSKFTKPGKGGFNLPSGARLVSSDDAIATVECFIPEGEDLKIENAMWQIIPHGGAARMSLQDWNVLIGQQMQGIAYGRTAEIALSRLDEISASAEITD